jgi:serine phosphatase RsbU (regulator of sigma subunit)
MDANFALCLTCESLRSAMAEVSVSLETIGPSLIFVLGEDRKSYVINGPAFSIGRKADKDLTILNPRVSRDHAIILRESDGYVLQDQDSKHGTYVNGERITRRRLQTNDRIEFGARGEGFLVFNPEEQSSTSAREFLSQITGRKASADISDLELLTLFLEAARKLNTGGVLEEVLVTLIEALLKLTRSERGYVFLRQEDGTFRLAAARGEKGQPLIDDNTISHSIINDAVKAGKDFLVTDMGDVSKLAGRESVMAQQLRTVICIPLRRPNIVHAGGAHAEERKDKDEIRAVLYLDSRKTSGKLSAVSHDILKVISTEAATLVENARLVQSDLQARRYQEELNIAANIQRQLMLVDIPEVPFAKVMARSIPCTEIGGDFFDIIYTGEELAVVVADVCGKGVSAALLASIIQGMIYSQVTQHRSLAEGVVAVNRFLCERNLGEKYSTLLLARIRPTGLLEYVNCGHVPPILISKGQVNSLAEGNMPVGLFKDAEFEVGTVQCLPGDRLLIVTDGVTEAENPAGDFFGYEALAGIAPRTAGIPELMEQITRFCDGTPMRDDCTALELTYLQ